MTDTTNQAQERPDVLPSEAIIGFAAFLTCGVGTLTVGSCHEAGTMAKLVEAYRQSQGWPKPREDFAFRLKRCAEAVFPDVGTPGMGATRASELRPNDDEAVEDADGGPCYYCGEAACEGNDCNREGGPL